MPSALDALCPTDAEDLRTLNLRIGTTQALLDGLRRERDRKLDQIERRTLATPGGAVQFETLLDHATADRTGLSLEEVRRRRQEQIDSSRYGPDALSIQGHELESGEADIRVED